VSSPFLMMWRSAPGRAAMVIGVSAIGADKAAADFSHP
jgi:hypothetical protein